MRDKEKQKAAQAKHYLENKEKYRESVKKYRQKVSATMEQIKDVPCMDCGIKYPPKVMDFDHRDPSTKEMVIGDARRKMGLTKLLAEIEKCDIICANCHRIRTFYPNGY